MAVASRHIEGDDANIATHAHTLQPSRTSIRLAQYIPVLGGGVQVVLLRSDILLLPVGLGRIDGRAQLGGRVEDLVIVYDSEAVDGSEGLGKMLLLVIGGERQGVHHVGELLVGEGSVVDDSAVSCDTGQSTVSEESTLEER